MPLPQADIAMDKGDSFRSNGEQSGARPACGLNLNLREVQIVNTKTVNVLGTDYSVIFASEQEEPRLCGMDGFCDDSVKEIYVDDMSKAAKSPDSKKDLETYRKKVVRHELIHAMLSESGLQSESAWAMNEEMVDWIAIQGPKLMEVWSAAKCL